MRFRESLSVRIKCLPVARTLIVLLAVTGLAQSETFKTAPLIFASGEAPLTIAAGDINRDGKVDMAYWNGEVNLLLNQEDGQFHRSSFAGPTSFVRLLALEDINNDQKFDLLLTTNSGFQRRLIVFRGKGDGTFESPITSAFVVPLSPLHPALIAMAAGHLNNDEHLDLILGDAANDMLNVLLGRGDGNFDLHASMQQFSAAEVVVVDFNRDGKLDLFAVSQLGGDVTVRLGVGDGTFGPGIRHTLPAPIRRARFADANGDDIGDLIGISDLGRIEVMVGRGDGTFQLVLQTPEGFAGGSNGRICAATDFNQDGKLDIAISARNGIVALLGTGDLSFGSPATYPVRASTFLLDPVMADFNGDGSLDFAIPGIRDAPVALLFGNSDGTFQAADAYDVGGSVASAALADANEDGVFDILVGAGHLGVLLGSQNGRFQLQPRPPGSSVGVGFIDVADFDSDSHTDVVFSQIIQYGRGDGTFEAPVAGPAASTTIQQLFAGELDSNLGGDIAQFTTQGITFFSGNGDRTFQPGVNINTGFSPRSHARGDFNGDGFKDIAIGNVGEANVSVLLGTMLGFLPAVQYPLPNSPSDAAPGDFDGDGSLDLVLAQNGTNKLAFLFNTGDGTFGPAAVVDIPTPAAQVATGDFNGDEKLDVVASGNLLTVLHGAGDGSFDQGHMYVGGSIPAKALVQDFNTDDAPDLALPNVDVNGTSTVTVLLNRGGTRVSLVGSAATSIFSQPTAFTARVSESLPGSGTPTGSVTFRSANLVLGTAALAAGEATLFTQSIPAGLHHISATYNGDGIFNRRHFGDVVHHVIAGSQTGIAASANPSVAGEPVLLTITVSAPSGVPQGVVELHKQGSMIGSAHLIGGVAEIGVPTLTHGLHIFTARYLGGPDHFPSNSMFFQFANVAGASTTTTSLSISSISPAPATPFNLQHLLFRERLVLTATVAPSGVLGGTVTFYDGDLALGASVPLVGGQAVLILAGLPVRARHVRAVYEGDGLQVGGSVSPTVMLSRSPRPR